MCVYKQQPMVGPWLPKLWPNMEVRSFRSGHNCVRSPFYTHESGKRTNPGRIKRAPCDSRRRFFADHWCEPSLWIERLNVFLSFHHMYLNFIYLLYSLLWCYCTFLFLKSICLLGLIFDSLGDRPITSSRTRPRKDQKMLGHWAAIVLLNIPILWSLKYMGFIPYFWPRLKNTWENHGSNMGLLRI